MKIIAFDLGSEWAFATNYGQTEHFVETGDRPARLHSFSKRLGSKIVCLSNYDLVIYERPFARGQHATRSLWGMAGVLEAAAAPYCAILDPTPGEIKRFATGCGSADKASMFRAARSTGYLGNNEHEADAWCLMQYAKSTCKEGT